MPQTWTIQNILDYCVKYLEAHNDEHPRRSAEWILGAALDLSRVELYAYFDRPVSPDERDIIRESLKRRGAGEPLQYVTGEVGFRHIVVRTAKGVLIPRPETEVLVGELIDALKGRGPVDENTRVLEVGCGTGCVACSLAKEAGARVTATDISPEAIACATRNVEVLALDELVTLVETDCVAGVGGDFDAIISNPPYIPTAVMAELSQEVIGFEPHLALDGGADGLEFFRRLLSEALPLLKAGGVFACELHETCLDAAVILARDAGLTDVRAVNDLAERPRILIGAKQ